MAGMNAWGRGWVEEPGWEDAVRNHRARNKVSHDNAIYVSLPSEWLSDPPSLISDLKYICIYLERGKVQWRACGSQRTTSRNHFSLCTMTALGTEPDHQTWRQAPSPAGSSHYFFFFITGIQKYEQILCPDVLLDFPVTSFGFSGIWK